MRWIPGVRHILRRRARQAGVARRAVEDELEFHLDMRARELESEGWEPAAARARALTEFGDLEGARRRLVVETLRVGRRSRRGQWWEEWWQDVRYGWRGLRARPGFALVAVLTLALGIGANTAIFSVVNAVLWRPLPYAHPDRLVMLWESRPPELPRNVVSTGNYLDWRDETHSYEELGAYMLDFGYGLTGEGNPVQVTGAQLTPSVFRVLGVGADLGRVFTTAEGTPGNGDVVLLTHGFWQRQFGGDPGVVGRRLTLDGQPYTVVGVLGPTFDFPSRQTEVVFPLTLGPTDRSARKAHKLHVVGRLKPDITAAQAQADLQRVAAAIQRAHPEAMAGWTAVVKPLRADMTRGVRSMLLVLLGAVGLVLLIACANVANLLLTRGLGREREVAVRAALGAGRNRLLRQFLAEGVLLAGLGGALGLVLGTATMRGLVAIGRGQIPLLEGTRADSVVLGFTLGLSLLSVLFFAMVPALRSSRPALLEALREGHARAGTGLRHRRLHGTLLVAEVALSAMLLVGAGLLVRSFLRLEAVSYGFDPDHVLTAALNLPVPKYSDPAQQTAFYQQVLERIRAIPGVQAATATTDPPVVGFQMTFSVAVEGHTYGPGERDDFYYRGVMPGYFAALGIPVLAGRGFAVTDRRGTVPVAVVNEAFARRFWPQGSAVGRRIRLSEDGPWVEVVGVAGNTRHRGLEMDMAPAVYGLFAQKSWDWLTWMTLEVRSTRPPLSLVPAVRRAVWSVDADLPIQRFAAMNQLYAESNARRRFATLLLTAFAGLALLLGTVGMYGVMSYTVAQRAHEIGIRMALGARRRGLVLRVLAGGLGLAGVGVAIGLVGAVALRGFLRALLFGIGALDPITLGGVVILLLGVAGLACGVPALRASRTDPLTVLREG